MKESVQRMTEITEVDYVPKFILIDDDPVTNAISEVVIKIALGKVPVKVFTGGNEGLEFIKSYIPSSSPTHTIILLDLNMPIISGWEFLEYFDQLPEDYKGKFRLYVLSSSVDDRDKARAYANKNVIEFLVKPLSKEVAMRIDGE